MNFKTLEREWFSNVRADLLAGTVVALALITLDFSQAHLWDQAAVGAIDQIVLKFRRTGAEVELVGLNEASATLLDNLAIHNKSDAVNSVARH